MSWILCKFRCPSSQKGYGRIREGITEKGRKTIQKYQKASIRVKLNKSTKGGKEITEEVYSRSLKVWAVLKKKKEMLGITGTCPKMVIKKYQMKEACSALVKMFLNKRLAMKLVVHCCRTLPQMQKVIRFIKNLSRTVKHLDPWHRSRTPWTEDDWKLFPAQLMPLKGFPFPGHPVQVSFWIQYRNIL